MSTLFDREIFIPVWAGLAFGLFTLFGPSLTPVTGSLLLCTAIAPPAVMLILSRAQSLTLAAPIADVLDPVDRSGTERRRSRGRRPLLLRHNRQAMMPTFLE